MCDGTGTLCSLIYVCHFSVIQHSKIGSFDGKKQYIKNYENAYTLFGANTKPCKTICILKGYTDSYSDLNRNLQMGPYLFHNVRRNPQND